MSLTDALRSRLTSEPDHHGDPLPEGDLFDLLSSPRRRWVIEALAEFDRPVSFDNLARALACYESDEAERFSDVSAKARKRAWVSLYQTHLPMFVEYDIVEWVGDHTIVRPTARCHRLAAAIEAAREANGA